MDHSMTKRCFPLLATLLLASLLAVASPASAQVTPDTGTLSVAFSHGGMAWFLDGKRMATSPFAVRSYTQNHLAPGNHALRITDATGRALLWEGGVTVRAGATTRGTLQPDGAVSFGLPEPGQSAAQAEQAWPAPLPPEQTAARPDQPLDGRPAAGGMTMAVQAGPQGAWVQGPGVTMQVGGDPQGGWGTVAPAAVYGPAQQPYGPPVGAPGAYAPAPQPYGAGPEDGRGHHPHGDRAQAGGLGALLFLSQDGEWCDIYVDGEKKGEIRNDPRLLVANLPGGSHTVEVRSFTEDRPYTSSSIHVHPGFTANVAVREGAPLQVMNRP